MNESQFSEFLNHYYRRQSTDQVIDALEHFLSLSHLDEHGRLTGTYAFSRMGQLTPELVPEYEQLFRRRAEDRGWRIVLDVLRQTASPQSKTFLKRYQREAHSSEVKAAIAAALDDWSGPMSTALESRISAPGDLDFLWTEFGVTGRREAVAAIIDVLAWPDRVRALLEDWLASSQHAGLFERLRHRRLSRRLAGIGAVLDLDSRKMLSTKDMDLCCCMEGLDFSDKKFERSLSILPFSLSPDDTNHVTTKAAAMWSLSSCCYEDPMVRTICDAESGDRSGSCRLTLLEILCDVALLSKDLGTAVSKLYESLSPVPKKRIEYLKKCERRFATVIELSADESQHCTDVAMPVEHISRCIEVSRRATSYCSRLSIGVGAEELSSADGIMWRLEFIKPDRFRVFQVAGKDADEWVTLGRRHYRGPMFAVASRRKEWESDYQINHSLLIDRHLNVMADKEPASVREYEVGDERYYVLDYKNIDVGKMLSPETLEKDSIRAQFWVEASTDYLVRVDIVAGDSRLETAEPQRSRGRVIHLFAGFDEDILIVPPAFQLAIGGALWSAPINAN